MTAADALGRVAAAFPHAQEEGYAMQELLRVENLVRTEVLGEAPLGALEPDSALSVSGAYEGLYEHFVAAMLAGAAGETARCNNDMALYSALYDGFARARRREAAPVKDTQVRFG